MGKKHLLIVIAFVVVDIFLVGKILLSGSNIQLLNPQGYIAFREREILIIAGIITVLVALPVFLLTFFISIKYKDSNNSSKYFPDWDQSSKLEFLRWAIPAVIVLIFAIITWKSTHELDPLKPIASNVPPITIQVVALQWKWMFIYPEQNIATVNFMEFPVHTPVSFELTADAPMNSFWIPQLGGQMYAMAGMGTHTHLIADKTGEFQGSAAEMSGRGFAGMKFIAKAVSQEEFDAWVSKMKDGSSMLDFAEYQKLSKPSEDTPVKYYSKVAPGLYNDVIMKFMAPTTVPGENINDPDMKNMDMKGAEY